MVIAFDSEGDGERASIRLVHDIGARVRDLERRSREQSEAGGHDAEERMRAAERRARHADAATRAAITRAEEAEARIRALSDELGAAAERADTAEAWLRIAHGCLREMARQDATLDGEVGAANADPADEEPGRSPPS